MALNLKVTRILTKTFCYFSFIVKHFLGKIDQNYVIWLANRKDLENLKTVIY